MQFEPQIALEGLPKLALKSVIRIEPRDFELVLEGHQLEEIARHRFGEFGRTRRAEKRCARVTATRYDPEINMTLNQI